jgi:hypothetical protein
MNQRKDYGGFIIFITMLKLASNVVWLVCFKQLCILCALPLWPNWPWLGSLYLLSLCRLVSRYMTKSIKVPTTYSFWKQSYHQWVEQIVKSWCTHRVPMLSRSSPKEERRWEEQEHGRAQGTRQWSDSSRIANHESVWLVHCWIIDVREEHGWTGKTQQIPMVTSQQCQQNK